MAACQGPSEYHHVRWSSGKREDNHLYEGKHKGQQSI